MFKEGDYVKLNCKFLREKYTPIIPSFVEDYVNKFENKIFVITLIQKSRFRNGNIIKINIPNFYGYFFEDELVKAHNFPIKIVRKKTYND